MSGTDERQSVKEREGARLGEAWHWAGIGVCWRGAPSGRGVHGRRSRVLPDSMNNKNGAAAVAVATASSSSFLRSHRDFDTSYEPDNIAFQLSPKLT
ncbi:hypothetical protein Q7C36_000543 [Tachysurus vachellii]|uniref:Uncharacterized protein n=1 Tax=Tachysurus vachellii TaxID=175792 RepID=A0AA88NW85_TACVA|nr:hypothetical protein Q7C36_000543 [Tachysurus vachellii]